MTATVRKSKVARLDWEQMAKDDTWRQKAVCRNVDTNIFYPEADTSPALSAMYERAKRYCAVCPVREECLEAAMREEEFENTRRYGVRGGMSPGQRKVLRAQQRGIHGYSMYTIGCRCDVCTNANRQRVRNYRANKAS